MTNELKPCPFCGGEEVRIAVTQHPRWYYGECEECGARTDFYLSQAEAIAAWNTRAERTCTMESGIGEWFNCSECLRECAGDQYGEMPNYCANCGAKVVE